MSRRSILLLAVCATAHPVLARGGEPYRICPDFKARMAQVRTIGIVAPDLKVFELSANNTPVLQADQTDAAAENVAATLALAFLSRDLDVRRLGTTPGMEGPGWKARCARPVCSIRR